LLLDTLGGRSCPLLALPAVSRPVPMLVGVPGRRGFNTMGHRRYGKMSCLGRCAARAPGLCSGHSRVRGPRARRLRAPGVCGGLGCGNPGGRRPPPTVTPARERLAIGDYSLGSRRQQRAEGQGGGVAQRRQRGRKEAEGKGAARVPPARAAVAAPRCARAAALSVSGEIGRKREGGEEK